MSGQAWMAMGDQEPPPPNASPGREPDVLIEVADGRFLFDSSSLPGSQVASLVATSRGHGPTGAVPVLFIPNLPSLGVRAVRIMFEMLQASSPADYLREQQGSLKVDDYTNAADAALCLGFLVGAREMELVEALDLRLFELSSTLVTPANAAECYEDASELSLQRFKLATGLAMARWHRENKVPADSLPYRVSKCLTEGYRDIAQLSAHLERRSDGAGLALLAQLEKSLHGASKLVMGDPLNEELEQEMAELSEEDNEDDE